MRPLSYDLVIHRRQFVVLGIRSAAFLGLGACTSSNKTSSQSASGSAEAANSDAGIVEDFSVRFAAFEVADEPNGDLSKVEWQSFVTDGEVRTLYEFQITNGETMRYMPCFCGCGNDAGHRNNRDCYVQSVGADGSVVLDSMAPT